MFTVVLYDNSKTFHENMTRHRRHIVIFGSLIRLLQLISINAYVK